MRRLFPLLLLLCAVAPMSVRAQATPPTLDEYERLVREAYAAASRSDRIGLDDAARRIAATGEVQLPDGATVPANNAWLAEALQAEPPDYPVITARLGAILDAAGQTRADQDADALQKLDEVFARPPFASREVPSAWSRFWRAVGDAIEAFFDRLFRSLPTPSGSITPPATSAFGSLTPTGWALLITGVLLLLALIIYAIRGVRRSVVSDARARAAVAADEEDISANEALDRAQNQARDGDYRTAMRYLYLSSLLWLDERKLLRYDRSLTNREYLIRSAGNPQLEERLRPVITTFDRVWYGRATLDEGDFQAYEDQVKRLRELEQQA